MRAYELKKSTGFTFIELVLVLLILSLLATLAAPVVSTSIIRSKESVLKENLKVTRIALDDYFADNGVYPEELEKLVERRYLRSLPVDPILKSNEEWVLLETEREGFTGIDDLKSGSSDQALNGSYYNEW